MHFRKSTARRLSCLIWLCQIVLAWTAAACLQPSLFAVEPSASTLPAITEVGQFYGQDEATRQRPHPVRLELLVYYYDPEWNLCWGESPGSVGFVPVGEKPLPIKSGQRYLVEGTAIPVKGLSPSTLTYTLLPETPIVPQKITEFTNNPAYMSRIVTLEGYVNDALDVTNFHWRLELISNGALITCNIWHDSPGSVPYKPGSMVRVTGLYLYKSDPSGLLESVDIWAGDPSKVEVIGTLKDDPRFDIPITPIERLPQIPRDKLIRVSGRVRRFTPGREIIIRDDTGQLRMRTNQTLSLKAGDEVEAIGYTWINGTEWTLRRGLYRVPLQSATANAPHHTTLRLAEQVLELSPELAAQAYPVQIRGIVLWSSPDAPYFIVKDSSAGVRVYRDNSDVPPPNVSNDVVVGGTTIKDQYVNAVRLNRIDTAGNLTLPEARPITLEHALTGVEENQWVEMAGYVREVRREGSLCLLLLTAAGGEFTARLPGSPEIEKLTGAIVRVQGVCTAQVNADREITGIQLQVPWAYYIQTEEQAPEDPFNAPARNISELRQFNARDSQNRRLRFTGTVIYQQPGRQILLQNQDEILHVQTRAHDPLAPGDLVEVVGFPGRQDGEIVLRETIYRKIGTGRQPPPIPLQNVRNPSSDLDDRLVRTSGVLIEKTIQTGQTHLTLQTKDAVVEATLRCSPKTTVGENWELGSILTVTGVYELKKDEFGLPQSFSLELRTPADVIILKRPPWWTTDRIFAVTSITFGGAFTVMFWVLALRRRIKKQTAQIRLQIEKESHLEAQYREIFESASDFIFTMDLDGRFTSFNRAGEKMTGYTREQALRMNFRDLVHPDDISQTIPLLQTAATRNDDTVTFQSRFRTRTGGVTWAETGVQLIMKAGRPVGMLGVVRDINERKQTEEALREARDTAESVNRAKSAFLANMSHEIRTPMNGVIGMSNLLLDTKLNSEQRGLANTVKQSAEALLTLLNDILDFSKIEAGKLQFDAIDFELRELIDSTIELVAPRAHEKGLEIGALIPLDVPGRLRGDPGRLRQVLLNFLTNAVKFTDKGDIFVSVSLDEETSLGVRLRIKISDTGVGLTDEARARLFKPFNQADESTSRKYGGTGLGLAISKQLIELMDGTVGVDSTPGEGSTFWFTVLLAKQKQTAPATRPDKSIDHLKDVSILIIDPHDVSCRILQHYLATWKMNIYLARNRKVALERLQDARDKGHPIEILLISESVEEIDGIALAREIQQLPGPPGRRTLLLTTGTPQVSKNEFKAAGILDYIGKPIRQSELLTVLLRALRVIEGTRATHHPVPTAPTAETTPSQPSTTPPPSPPTGKSLRILVAEDNAVNQRVTTMHLKKLGHTTEVAANGLEVFAALEKSTYDLILMDCQMPEMDGYETTRRLRLNPAHKKLWIIAMTANAMIGDREICLEAGMNDYITKPTRPQDLAAALARCPAAQIS